MGGKHTGPRVQRISYQEFEAVGLLEPSPMFKTRAEAETWLCARLAELRDAARPKFRACLCCKRSFASEGAHNRLCDTCRSKRD